MPVISTAFNNASCEKKFIGTRIIVQFFHFCNFFFHIKNYPLYLDLMPYVWYNQGSRCKAIGIPFWVWNWFRFVGQTSFFFYYSIIFLIDFLSSSSVSHFSINSSIALSNASVTFISFMSSLPFVKGFILCLTFIIILIIEYMSIVLYSFLSIFYFFIWFYTKICYYKIKEVITCLFQKLLNK